MREAEKVERLRAALTAAGAALDCVATELQYSRLCFVERETELAQTFPQAAEERASILGGLEAHDAIVGVPDDDHIPFGLPPTPLMRPKIEDVMEVDIG